MAEVLFLTRVLTHYRTPFHEAVRARLAQGGVNYRLAYGRPTPSELRKGDLAELSWAESTPTHYFGASDLAWQTRPKGRPDLLIIGQENKNLGNYSMLVRRMLGLPGPKLAFFGHGKNFQADDPNSRAERFKRFWVDKVDWWFAYTEKSAEVVTSTGFPRERITVFNNAIDTSAIRRELGTVTREEQRDVRRRFRGSENIGVYVGGLYPHKRVPFLIEAAKAVRARVPDFQLLVIGSGVDAPILEAAAREHDWIHALGPKFGREKTLLLSLGKVMLMPGLVGLGVLDSFAYGLPMVTTALPYHSPEIDYLQDRVNGLIVKDPTSLADYSQAVAHVLLDRSTRNDLRLAALASSRTLTIEDMAARFSSGIFLALAQSGSAP
jgi:glycosyltransferase involved in cell wall biosynthesis